MSSSPRDIKQAPTVRIHRSKIKNAEYNPRTITAPAKRKLRKLIQKHGIVSNPTWNVRTGNVIGGHQRISQLDAIYGTTDYSLDVSQVDVPDKTEREMNVGLNSQYAQGEFEIESLLELIDDTPDFSFDNAGIEPMCLEEMAYHAGLETTRLDSMFGEDALEEIHEISDEIDELMDESDEIRKSEKTGETDGGDQGTDGEDVGEQGGSQAPQGNGVTDIELIKDRKKEFAGRASQENDEGYFLTLVFPSFEIKRRFLDLHGIDKGDFCQADVFAEQLGFTVDITTVEPGDAMAATASPDRKDASLDDDEIHIGPAEGTS